MEQNPLDWARLDIQRFEAAGNMQLKSLQVQADYAFRMAAVAEKQVKVEKDKVKLAQLKDSFQNLKGTRHRLDTAIAANRREAETYARHARWVRKIALGATLPRSVRTYMWSAFYFFMDKVPDPLPDVPTDVLPPSNFVDANVLDEVVSPWDYLLQLRAKNAMPKTGSPATRYIYGLVEAMCAYAAIMEGKAQAEAAEYQEKLD